MRDGANPMTTYSSVMTDYLGEGVAASRQATPPIAPTALGFYYETDSTALTLWNGTGWVTVSVGQALSSVGAGLTISAAGTVALGTIPAGELMGNAGTVAAAPSGITIGSGLSLSAAGTLTATGGGGGATTIVAGAGLTGGTITTSGTVAMEASQLIRTIPFPMVGTVSGGQDMIITLTQAGTLLANGGATHAEVKVNPTATNTFTLNTINGGTVHTQGTVSVSTSGVVTFPTFTAVPFAAGDSIELINQATADATFANACLSFQFQVT
jgi:hypothetical protein